MTLLRLFIVSAWRLLRLTVSGLWPRLGSSAGPLVALGRVLVILVFVPLFAVVQLIHWIGFLLDEVFFPDYRRVEIKEPLFVLGVPRSGTTHLHRVLAEDPQFTTFSTWECLFALSVTERRFWLGLADLDRRLGGYLARALGWIETRAFGGMASIHPMRLSDPEEDYFALIPVLAAFILILPFPTDPYLWRMGSFDRDMPAPERARLIAFYRGCLQRHLYVHGPGRRLLSKNAAFAPLAGSLAAAFPDARFLVCVREPERTLPSQLSSVESGVRFFGVLAAAPAFRERLAGQLGFYYRNLDQALGDLDADRCAWVTMTDVKDRLSDALVSVYQRLGLDLTAGFRARLSAAAALAKGYRSGHNYSLEQFGLSPHPVDADLVGVYQRLAVRSVLAARPAPGVNVDDVP